MDNQVRINFLKYYLGTYAAPTIDAQFFHAVSEIELKGNIIVQAKPDINTIKQLITTFLIKDRKVLDYTVVTLKEIADRVYQNHVEDNYYNPMDYLLRRDFLFVIEMDDPRNETYKELISTVVTRRALQGKVSVVVLTTRSINELFSDVMLPNYKIHDIRNNKARVIKQKKDEDKDISNEEYRKLTGFYKY